MKILMASILLVAVALFVLAPLFRRQREQSRAEARFEELEARKEAKYRELRDTELDHAAGKLSDEDYRERHAVLRSEASEILDHLERPPSEKRDDNRSNQGGQR